MGTRTKKGTVKKGDEQEEQFGDYKWINYSEVDERSKNFGAGLVNLGAKPVRNTTSIVLGHQLTSLKGDKIGIFSKNRAEWLITQQACYYNSLAIVSFYETLGKDSIRHVAKHAEIKLAVANLDALATVCNIMQEGWVLIALFSCSKWLLEMRDTKVSKPL